MSRARAGAKQAEPLVFRGPPERLASLLPADAAPADGAAEPVVEVKGADVRALRVRRRRRGGDGARETTLRLDEQTPPGRYEGTAEIEGRVVPIVAEVEPRPRLHAHPRRLELEAEPGQTVTAALTLTNAGNVPCEVAKASTFCLFAGGGLEHAFWAALANDPPEGRQRIDVLLDDLAGSHGGLVEARADGAGQIEPGESREVRLTLELSDRLRPRHRYAGAWEAEGLRVPVRVRVPERTRRSAKAAS